MNSNYSSNIWTAGCLSLKRSNLADHEVAFRIYYATDGLISYVMKLVRRASILAMERGTERVGMELLAESYDERLASCKPRQVTPFRVQFEELSDDPLPPAGGGAKRNNRRSKAKAASNSASEVLGNKG